MPAEVAADSPCRPDLECIDSLCTPATVGAYLRLRCVPLVAVCVTTETPPSAPPPLSVRACACVVCLLTVLLFLSACS